MDYRTALVTGASSGIGREIAGRLAARGIEVALAARRQEALEEVATRIRARGGRARVVPLDVTDVGAATDAIRAADDEMEGLDLIVASAGASCTRWSGKLRRQDWEPAVAVNVAGATATLLAVVGRMVDRRRGHLVGISSLAGYRARPGFAVYSATKSYLSTFLEGLRVDLLYSGVTVTDIRPGFVRTPMNEGSGPMPFEMSIDRAGEIIEGGVLAGRPVVEFPWQTAAYLRSTTMLPAGLYARVLAKKKS